jgi:hypothetical protein
VTSRSLIPQPPLVPLSFITPTAPSHNSKVVEEWGNWSEQERDKRCKASRTVLTVLYRFFTHISGYDSSELVPTIDGIESFFFFKRW